MSAFQKGHRPYNRGTWDARPLRSLLLRVEARIGGRNALVRHMAANSGLSRVAIEKAVRRVMNNDFVTLKVADELSYALGYHPGEVWGWHRYEEAS